MAACLLALGITGAAAAAPPVTAVARQAKPNARSWQILETDNFRILTYDIRPVGQEIGRTCELLRAALTEKWLGVDSVAWAPKCDIVLHPDDRSYLREVGAGAGNTVASSLVDQKRGQIRTRRVDVRSLHGDWLSEALPHELTHVILADGFQGRTLPRWIDEGLAILADPADKQGRHRAELLGALGSRSAFRVVELMTLEDYPAAHRWGAFYGQSASLVEFLVSQRSPAEFVRFAQLSLDQGYDRSLREVYGLSGMAEFERRWNAQAAEDLRLVKTSPEHKQHAIATSARNKLAKKSK